MEVALERVLTVPRLDRPPQLLRRHTSATRGHGGQLTVAAEHSEVAAVASSQCGVLHPHSSTSSSVLVFITFVLCSKVTL